MFNYKFYEYDQETRQWENYRISKTTVDSALTKGIDSSVEQSIYLGTLNEDPALTDCYSYPPHSHLTLYDNLRDMESFTDNIVFTIKGNLELDSAQVITIRERR